MTGFQTIVNRAPAPGIPGDFASDNPRATLVAGENGLAAGPEGVTLGVFAWADAAGTVGNARPASGVARLGFAAREGQNGLLLPFLTGAGFTIPAGQPVTLHGNADVWVTVTVAAAATGQKVFASTTDGTIQPGAAGAGIAGYVETPWFFVSDAAAGEVAQISQGG